MKLFRTVAQDGRFTPDDAKRIIGAVQQEADRLRQLRDIDRMTLSVVIADLKARDPSEDRILDLIYDAKKLMQSRPA